MDIYRGLVVDEDAMVRCRIIQALAREGIVCDAAASGAAAQELLAASRYHFVVLDVRLADGRGPALAMELLSRDPRPVVVLLAGAVDPRLAKDLLARGVDGIESKPVMGALFAAKVRALVERRKTSQASAAEERSGAARGPINAADVDRKLADLPRILPISKAAFDVFNMTRADSYQAPQIAAAIARDPSLSLEVLRLANSAFFNPGGRRIVDLDVAVIRIGQRHLGEVALAMGALAAVTGKVLPWMQVDLAWRRSVAAGVAVDMLLSQGKHRAIEEGLFLSAILHPMGRIALGMLFPQQYETMVRTCLQRGETLLEHEQRTFSCSQGDVMQRLLENWKVPVAICDALKHVNASFADLAALGHPLRARSEILKLGVLLARIAVGNWEAWDYVESCPSAVVHRLGIHAPLEIIDATRTDSEAIIRFHSEGTDVCGPSRSPNPPEKPRQEVRYCSFSPEQEDFLAPIISSMGVTLVPCEPDALEADESALVNCSDLPADQLHAVARLASHDALCMIVTGAGSTLVCSAGARVLTLPLSYGKLREACLELAKNPATAPR